MSATKQSVGLLKLLDNNLLDYPLKGSRTRSDTLISLNVSPELLSRDESRIAFTQFGYFCINHVFLMPESSFHEQRYLC